MALLQPGMNTKHLRRDFNNPSRMAKAHKRMREPPRLGITNRP